MLDSLTQVCIQYMIMLTELMNVVSQELKYLYNNTTTGISIDLHQKSDILRTTDRDIFL